MLIFDELGWDIIYAENEIKHKLVDGFTKKYNVVKLVYAKSQAK